jgi:hypothetical protein
MSPEFRKNKNGKAYPISSSMPGKKYKVLSAMLMVGTGKSKMESPDNYDMLPVIIPKGLSKEEYSKLAKELYDASGLEEHDIAFIAFAGLDEDGMIGGIATTDPKELAKASWPSKIKNEITYNDFISIYRAVGNKDYDDDELKDALKTLPEHLRKDANKAYYEFWEDN